MIETSRALGHSPQSCGDRAVKREAYGGQPAAKRWVITSNPLWLLLLGCPSRILYQSLLQQQWLLLVVGNKPGARSQQLCGDKRQGELKKKNKPGCVCFVIWYMSAFSSLQIFDSSHLELIGELF